MRFWVEFYETLELASKFPQQFPPPPPPPRSRGEANDIIGETRAVHFFGVRCLCFVKCGSLNCGHLSGIFSIGVNKNLGIQNHAEPTHCKKDLFNKKNQNYRQRAENWMVKSLRTFLKWFRRENDVRELQKKMKLKQSGSVRSRQFIQFVHRVSLVT